MKQSLFRHFPAMEDVSYSCCTHLALERPLDIGGVSLHRVHSS